MARGKGKFRRKHSLRNKQNPKVKTPKVKKARSTNGRDIKHRDQLRHQSTEGVKKNFLKRAKPNNLSCSEESEEEQDSYRQLLSTFTQSEKKAKLSVESEDELATGSSVISDDDSDDDPESDDQTSDFRNEKERDRVHNDSPNDILRNQETNVENAELSDLEEEWREDQNMLTSGAGPLQDHLDYGDPFNAHICCDLPEEAVDVLGNSKPPTKQCEIRWEKLGRILITIPEIPNVSALSSDSTKKLSLEEPRSYAQPGKVTEKLSEVDWNRLHVKPQLHDSAVKANTQNLDEDNKVDCLTPLQLELFTLMNSYQDLYFPDRTLSNGEAVRFTYCLHVANHVMKTCSKIVHHNTKLKKKQCTEVPEDFRDQGLVRPKVLVLVPFREQARRVVELLIKLLVPEESKNNVMNKKRFEEEFTGQELLMPKKNRRPEDYEALFSGNTDDTFRLGLAVSKKCLKLYEDFYSSDIIISSPLGLRMIIGAEGEAERDYDFLASIEILIIDQADVFLMQNWDHLLHMMDHLHLQPRESHGTDFSRVRSWAVNGWAKYYRQTILFSSVALPECSALFNKRCSNYAGCVRVANPITSGSICHVIVQLPQVFQQVEASSVSQVLDSRFNYFIKKVLPEHLDPLMSHTMIFVPSYFDYVRIRNFLRKEGHSFVQICEYSKDGKVARARDMFYHSQVQFLLYSERFHFFRRPCIKGIRHLVFYQPPNMPHFYSEMCNLMQESNQNPCSGSESNMTVTVLYSRFDAQQLAAIVGSDRASRMISSDRNVHMFVTGE